MKPTVTVLASGLKLLSFQGITTFQNTIVVATVDADLVLVGTDGSLKPWVNVARYGVPTGMVGLPETIVVAVSAQELKHFLIQVNKQGQLSLLADLSNLAGEFGAPFGVAAHGGYYPYYLVALSTDVIGSAGLIARVSHNGKTAILATLDHTAFGVGVGDGYALATQDNGAVVKILATGETQTIADLTQLQLGIPLDMTRLGQAWMLVTTTGWLVALEPGGNPTPIVNLTEKGFGAPTTLTAFHQDLVVATQAGNLLRVSL